MDRLPSKGPNSPFSAGNRTILARTCTACGILADGESFPLIARGRGGRRRACHHCVNARKKIDREERGIGVPDPRPPEDRQTSRWQRWSKEDDQYLREQHGHADYEDIAVHLGRSLRAVYKRREVLGLSAIRIVHRVADPWRISKASGDRHI